MDLGPPACGFLPVGRLSYRIWLRTRIEHTSLSLSCWALIANTYSAGRRILTASEEEHHPACLRLDWTALIYANL